MDKPVYRSQRPSSSKRGYGAEWRRIRKRVLQEAGIPRDQWSLYDVDHRPAYNPDIEPDHNKYTLVPMLHADHSKKTAKENNGYGNNRPRKKDDGLNQFERRMKINK